jgi:adenylate cyclase
VNLAARQEGANKQFGTYTMISQSTYDQLHQTFRTREMARLSVVGRKEPVTVYEPLADDDYEKKKSILQQFHRGLVSFYNGDMHDGERLFSTIEEADPCAHFYAKKCRSLMPMEKSDWEGVWVMNTK